MHFSICFVAGFLPAVFGFSHLVAEHVQRDSALTPNHFTWSPPRPGDFRAPCPVLNTLSNHDFLPHNGRNITLDKAIKALGDAMNISPEVATAFFNGGVKLNPAPNATFFDYDMLFVHNALEHDASMSRRDVYFDPSNRFDAATFDNFLSYFGDDEILTINGTADARARHAYDMSKINPEFNITEANLPVMIGEAAIMLLVWGSVEEPGAVRKYFEYFFRNERLPVALGWAPGKTAIALSDFTGLITEVTAASPADIPLLFPPKNTTAKH